MYNYSLDSFSRNSLLLRKHCFTLDQNISAIINYIDLINANYTVINISLKANSQSFYPNSFIISEIIDTTNRRCNIATMWPHQIIVNRYNGPLDVYYTSTDSEKLDVLEEGFALIKLNAKNQKDSYTIVSLDSSGTYYMLNTITMSGNILTTQWLYYPNATDEIGQTYVFSIIPPGTRLMYWSRDSQGEDFNTCNNINNSPDYIFLQSYNADSLVPTLASRLGSFWNNYLILGYDIYSIIQNITQSSITQYDISDIVCDDRGSTQQLVINKRPVSASTITTNLHQLESCDSIKFYVNYY